MKKEPLLLWNIRLKPVLGIGVWKDTYKKDVHGIDGWQYYILIPFATITFTKLNPVV